MQANQKELLFHVTQILSHQNPSLSTFNFQLSGTMIRLTTDRATTASVTTARFATASSVNHMEGVLYKLHSQICWFVLRNTSSRFRSWLEDALLCIAIACFGALIVSHLAFCHRATSVLLPPIQPPQVTTPSLVTGNIPSICLPSVPGFSLQADVTHLTLLPANEQSYAVPLDNTDRTNITIPEIYFTYSQVKGYLLLPPDLLRKHNLSIQLVAVSKNDPHCFGEPLLQFIIWRWSLIYWGTADTVMMNWFLGLDRETGYLHNPRTNLLHDLHHSHFGDIQQQVTDPILTTTMTSKTSAATTTELNSATKQFCQPKHGDEASTAASNESCKENDHNMSSQDWGSSRYFAFSSMLLSKFTVVLKTSFLFFITTTLVSFTLRETQQRMLAFTLALREHVRSQQPLALLIIRHIIENLVFCPIMVGIMFFLIEFYRGDKFLAFMVLSLVWVREVFSVIRYGKEANS
jgi:hypothetical protein